MKVDMSPQAVTARLKELDELWLLSMKLVNSRPAKPRRGKIGPDKMQNPGTTTPKRNVR